LKRKLIILIFAIISSCSYTIAQAGKNYPQFDRRKMHFGFSLGMNFADFNYNYFPGFYNQDTIVNVNVNRIPGFNLGIVSSWDIHETFHIRFIPYLSFQEREFQYQTLRNGLLITETDRLESTNLDFPLMLKLRTKRINNFAAYGLTGIQYSLDLASDIDVAVNAGDRIIKMQRHDFSTQFGGGFDFFMVYYKFAIEVKLSNGFKNLRIDDGSYFSSPLTSLKSKVWWFTITFEG